MSLEELEQQIEQLSPQEQLNLVAKVCEQLSSIGVFAPLATREEARRQKEYDDETERVISLMDEAAAMWKDTVDISAEIRELRDEDSIDLEAEIGNVRTGY